MSAVGAHKHTNRLAHETSPYLLQHAHNPVDWYAWGTEAFEAARKQNKPIFLSIGYSTCYWCHVMERQCFENEQIAREMNARFINIKVDREERTDIDQLYMLAVQVLTRQGGWPLSVFLTPDLRPFYGGTYFPPTDSAGRPGFLTILRAMDDTFRNRLAEVESTCRGVMNILQQLAEPAAPEEPMTIDLKFLEAIIDRSLADFDAEHGGFGSAPKFPQQTLLELLLVYLRHAPDSSRKDRVRQIVGRTLDAMAAGGIRDHLGGAFHRYSTDSAWMVPHFEIMLYDNAMLAWIYAEASQVLERPCYARVARGIVDFVLNRMTSPDGAFYTALDAETDGAEGQTYVWTADQIAAVLGPEDARLFNHVYAVDRGPNFADPHHNGDGPDRNVLYMPQPLAEVVTGTSQTPQQLEGKLSPMRRRLLAARSKRPQPALDTKIITSWNALMIRALAHAGAVMSEPRYISAARAAAEFLLKHHLRPDGGLWHVSREHGAKQPAFVDDYAHLALALQELSSVAENRRYRQQAQRLAAEMVRRFGEPDEGGFYYTGRDARDVIVRQKVASDSPLPSGNAAAAMVLLNASENEAARDTIGVFARQLEGTGESMSAMVEAALLYTAQHGPVSVVPTRGGQGRPPSPVDAAKEVVSVQAEWAATDELHLRVAIAEPYHINAHDVGQGLPPTTVNVVSDSAAVAGVEYPPGEEQRFAFAPEPVRVYTGAVTIVMRFAQKMAGAAPIRLALSYQPCSDQACLPAVTREIEVNTP